jgi:hypothetical protein
MRELKYAFLSLLLYALAAVPLRAQNLANCATLTATINVNDGSHAPYQGVPTRKDGNGIVIGATFNATISCVEQNGAAVTNATPSSLAIGATGDDTIPIGCLPAVPGCPSQMFENTCEPFFNTTTNNPTEYSSTNPNSFFITATSQTVSSLGSCVQTNATSQTSTCTPSGCALKSLTISPAAGSIVLGCRVLSCDLQYTALGTFSDGSTHDMTFISSQNYTGVATAWTTNDTSVATVTNTGVNGEEGPSGIVSPVGLGVTGVNAANGSITASASVLVSAQSVGGGGGGSTCTPPSSGGTKLVTDGGDPNAGQPCSPIILDLNGKGFVLTDAAQGVLFDIAGTGTPVQIAWTALGADNAFLALPGADGLVHDGKELFVNFTPQPKSDHPNGFAALAVYDLPANGGNGDGVIDARDKIFSSLRLWIDANHDGICQPEELHTLPSLGVVSISLNYTLSRKEDQYGNVFRYKAAVDPNDPDPTHVGRTAYDVFFVTLGQPAP